VTDNELPGRMADFDRCVQDRDQQLAEQVLHPDYALVLVHPEPSQVSRERWLATLPDYVVHSWQVEQQTVHVQDGCAAVLQRVALEATVPGVDRSGLFVLSDIWLRGDDGWRVWRRHSSPLSAGAMPTRA
jgi:Domain of unknown function (DUF4440)